MKIRVFFLFLMIISNYAGATQTWIYGEWLISGVYVDELATRSMEYKANDPRLMYRFLKITQNGGMSSNLSNNLSCTTFSVKPSALSFGEELNNSKGEWASINHYPLRNISANQQTWTINCEKGQWLKSASTNQDWLTRSKTGDILFGWYDGAILKAKKITPSELKPSFSCQKSLGDSEAEICRNPELASWDLSVHEAYQLAKRLLKDEQHALIELANSQKEWISQRNKCGNDIACLRKSMSSRVDVLINYE